MKALRWHAAGDVRLDDVALPAPPGPGEVQLRVTACGICGTDVEEWREGPMLIPVGTPHPLTGALAPLTLGHELAGEVVAAGPGSGLEVGAGVAVDGLVTCGVCRECRWGRPNLCPVQGQVGLMVDGGLQPLVNVAAVSCVAISSSMAPEAAAMTETLSVAVRALRRARLEPGNRVGVFGGGAVGLMAVQAARAMGAGHVTLVEPLESRRRLGLGLGANEVAAPSDLGHEQGGFDVAMECSGVGAAVGAAIASTCRAGRIVLVGISTATPPLDVWAVVAKEKEIVGSFSHVREQDFAGALGMLAAGAVSVDGLVTRVPLSRSLGDGLLALAAHPELYLKIMVVPDAVSVDSATEGKESC